MKEVFVKDNQTGMRVFINGEPKLENIPKEEFDIFISALELQIADYYKEVSTHSDKPSSD